MGLMVFEKMALRRIFPFFALTYSSYHIYSCSRFFMTAQKLAVR
jgi:hypothetical protein